VLPVSTDLNVDVGIEQLPKLIGSLQEVVPSLSESVGYQAL